MHILIRTTLVTIGILGCAMHAAALEVVEVRRVSVASDGTQANASSGNPASFTISPDGRFITFDSGADNLVPDDTNGVSDIFVHDIETRQTSRVSIAADGSEANGNSTIAAISANGDYVVFYSFADNLVANDLNGEADLFVRDVTMGLTTRVNVASDGTEANAKPGGVFSISGDGELILFASRATNLVAGDTNGENDIFLHERSTGLTTLVNISATGNQTSARSRGSHISSDGRWAAFMSDGTELTGMDTNGFSDVFVKDLLNLQIERISDAADGSQSNGEIVGDARISSDGRWVAFGSSANNLIANDNNGASDVFVRDRQTGQTTRVTENSNGIGQDGNSLSSHHISGNGRFVTYSSDSTNIVPTGITNSLTQIFVHDRNTGETIRVTNTPEGNTPFANQWLGGISDDGLAVVFQSAADDILPGIPSQGDVYLVLLTNETDADGDGVENSIDNCMNDANPGQEDLDNDDVGDACDPDIDGDQLPNDWEIANGLNQMDASDASLDPDMDGLTNLQEFSANTDPNNADTDSDAIQDDTDNCPAMANADQLDTDGDTMGNVCDADDDNDGVVDSQDAFPLDASRSSQPAPPKKKSGGGAMSPMFIFLLSLLIWARRRSIRWSAYYPARRDLGAR